MDYMVDGRARVVVVILSNLSVVEKGTRGDGTFSWCTMEIDVGRVCIGSIYSPNQCAQRIAL